MPANIAEFIKPSLSIAMRLIITPLFNPRTQTWAEHFQLDGGFIQGLTDVGRTTQFLLKMNEGRRLQLRQALISQGVYPDLPKQIFPGFM